ncbi:MAG: tRNA lysidine(34) synthetase TilS [Candidatus Omnitrophica bacterium]|nr:tRNA lysidine(34) synthetase TilS [Candidatus Omnitrophota bacterium]
MTKPKLVPASSKQGLSYSAFLKRVKDTIKRGDMFHKGDRVLVAVSGGADSVCLLKVLLETRKTYAAKIIVANMDHCLRGARSRKDSEFVKILSRELNVEFLHKKVKVKSVRARGVSLEECARSERYKFLKEAAAKKKCNVIATGHTMDDQAETVLMRIISGAGLAGLAGIPAVRYVGKIKIVRPLIRTTKRDILGFLKNEKIPFVEDESNLDLKFARNNIRHKILPFLEEYNPKIRRTLANLAETLREDYSYLSAHREKAVGKYGKRSGRILSVKIRDMVFQPETVRKEIFKTLIIKAGGNVKKLNYRHWIDMNYFLVFAKPGKSLDLPGEVKITKKRGEIIFKK